MNRTAANLLGAAHAVIELAIIYLLVAGPLHLASIALLVVAVPMVVLRGRCWLTEVERKLRGRKVSSMTRRLVWWATLGVWRPSVRAQWWLMAGIVAWWVVRVLTLIATKV